MKPKGLSFRAVALPAAATLFFALGNAGAASIALINMVRYDTNQPVGNNLTTQGSVDWAYWAANTAGTTTYPSPYAPTNDKATGGTIISGLSVVGGGSLRGTDQSDASSTFTWSDGSLAGSTARTNQNLPGGLIFSSAVNTGGSGISLTVTGAVPGQTYYVMLYLGGFGATGNLSLSLPGVALPVTDSTQVFAGTAPKSVVGYQVAFTPDAANDKLTVTYTASSSTSGSGHVGIEAVAVSTTQITPLPAVPEPTVALLSGIGSLLLFRRRKSC